jgi:hypothetical protein
MRLAGVRIFLSDILAQQNTGNVVYPQGLKPGSFFDLIGTAEAVP